MSIGNFDFWPDEVDCSKGPWDFFQSYNWDFFL